MNMHSPVKSLPRVGPKTLGCLNRLGIKTIADLLFFFPFRYEDYSRIVSIAAVRAGENVTVKAKIELIAAKRSLRRRLMITEALATDATGSLRVVWFNQPFLTKNIKAGDELYLSGNVKQDLLGPQLVSPAYEKAPNRESARHTARLVPVYPLTEGITEKQLRELVMHALEWARSVPEWLPEEIRTEYGLLPLETALRMIHFPPDAEALAASTERLKFDELFLLQLAAETARLANIRRHAPTITFQEEHIKKFVGNVGFNLTNAQRLAAWEIVQDLEKTTPMNRLLSGDVGSGKTVVAAIALYNTVLGGYQGVIMVPTEILAGQHFATFSKLLGPYGVRVALYTRSQRLLYDTRLAENNSRPGPAALAGRVLPKKKLIETIGSGGVDVIIGTHALLSEGVEIQRPGLVIIDEQHRFGVRQRKLLKDKAEQVHFLSMTATPIPRSLALLLYGDLDISIINEMPAGRKKIVTRVVEPAKRERAYQFIRDEVRRGHQVFVVCPLITTEGAKIAEQLPNDKKSVLKEYEKLSGYIFPDLKVGYMHGRMKGEEKEGIMRTFQAGQIDILVSTSVIEVGVNIPNATVMMIEDAERFGLAQLHQFRGRVGRSDHQSYCLLFTNLLTDKIKERLSFFETHHDGFKLAEKDLEIRGPGEVYGTAQSGLMQLRLATLRDQAIIKKARQAAQRAAPFLSKYPEVKKRLDEWGREVHLE